MMEHIVPANINIKTNKLLNFPPWQMVKPTVNLDLTKFAKSTTNQLIYQQYFAELKSSYPDHVSIYTDGSKDGVSVTAAAIVNSQPLTCRLPDDSSIFSAEAKAIQIALEAIRGLKAGPYILFSDSLSCLQAITNYCDNPFITVKDLYYARTYITRFTRKGNLRGIKVCAEIEAPSFAH